MPHGDYLNLSGAYQAVNESQFCDIIGLLESGKKRKKKPLMQAYNRRPIVFSIRGLMRAQLA